jgi:hypothetical protein
MADNLNTVSPDTVDTLERISIDMQSLGLDASKEVSSLIDACRMPPPLPLILYLRGQL